MSESIFGLVEKDERSDRARRAVKVFRQMQPTLTGYARALTGRKDISVELAVGAPRTDGKKIYFRPPMALGDNTPHQRSRCDKRDPVTVQQLCPACAVREEVLVSIIHEISHNAFGTFEEPAPMAFQDAMERAIDEAPGAYAKAIRKNWDRIPDFKRDSYLNIASLISPFLPVLVNALEDARVDEAQFRARKGTRKMFDAALNKVFTEGIEDDEGKLWQWRDKPLNSQALIGVFVLACNYKFEGWFAPEIDEALKDERLRLLCGQVNTIRSAEGTYNLAFPILARLRELGFCRSEADPEVPEEQQPEDPEENEENTDDEEADSEDSSPEGEASDYDDAGPDEDESGEPSPDGDAGEPGDESDADEGDSGASGGPESDEDQGDEASPGDPGDTDEGVPGDPEVDSGPGSGDDSGDGEEGEPSDGADGGGSDGESDRESEEHGSDDGRPGADGEESGDESSDGGLDDSSVRSEDGSPDSGPDEGSTDGLDDSEGSGEDSSPSETESREGGDEDSSPGREGEPGGGGSVPEGSDIGGDADGGSPESGEPAPDGDLGEPQEGGDSDSGADGSEPEGGTAAPQPGFGGPVDWLNELGDEQDSDAEHGNVSEHGGDAPVGEESGVSRDAEGVNSTLDEGSPGPELDPSSSETGQPETEELGDDGPADRASGEVEDLVDTLADDGMGGDKIDSNPNYGDAEKAFNDVMVFSKHDVIHGEQEKTVEDKANDKALDLAIMQGGYFESPSVNITGVREHIYSNRENDDGADGWNNYDAPYYKQYRKALGGEMEDDELKVGEEFLGPALIQMRRTFADNKRASFEKHRKSGRINPKVLGKRAPFGDERLFQKKRLPGKRDYRVLIGLDISGSTIGKNLTLIKRAGFAQAELCHRMGIDFAVYAHSGSGWDDDEMFMDIYEIKSFDQPWNPEAQEALSHLCSDAQNLDGHTIEYYRKVMDRQTATDKIIMYYTDGKMPAENHDEELEILQREIRVCKQKGYSLMGVGIRTDSPVRHGLDTVQVDDDEDLVKVIRHLETALLRHR